MIPMIQLARLVDEPARKVRTTYEQQVEEPQRSAYGKLANVRFAAVRHRNLSRCHVHAALAFGLVKGYQENGQQCPPGRRWAGLFQRAERARQPGPVRLAARVGSITRTA